MAIYFVESPDGLRVKIGTTIRPSRPAASRGWTRPTGSIGRGPSMNEPRPPVLFRKFADGFWQASLEGADHIVGCGLTPEEAIGWLCLRNPQRMGIPEFRWADPPPNSAVPPVVEYFEGVVEPFDDDEDEEEPPMPFDEASYVRGSRAAWRAMLGECLRQLGVDDPEAGKARWVAERADAVAMLRMVCDEHGDNDWPDAGHLGDVIEKHLWKHLPDVADEDEDEG